MSATFPDPAALVANSAGPLVRFWLSRRMQFLLVAVLSVLPYLASLNFGLVYDDAAQVLQNPLLSSWHSLSTFFTHQSWSSLYPAARADYYRPVLLIWLALNRHLFGLHPAGWHFESVAWISGSTDLLACFGMLVSLLLWWRSVESRSVLLFSSRCCSTSSRCFQRKFPLCFRPWFCLRLASSAAIGKYSISSPLHCQRFAKNHSLCTDSLSLSSPSWPCSARPLTRRIFHSLFDPPLLQRRPFSFLPPSSYLASAALLVLRPLPF